MNPIISKCEYCGQICNSLKELHEHLIKCEATKNIICKCGKHFDNIKSYNHHKEACSAHLGKKPNRYCRESECNLCHTKFKSLLDKNNALLKLLVPIKIQVKIELKSLKNYYLCYNIIIAYASYDKNRVHLINNKLNV